MVDAAPFLNETPVDVTLKALQDQLQELQKMLLKRQQVQPQTQEDDSTHTELHKEIAQLRVANAKAEYRIAILLRALDERDKQ
ncbi:hypothetical protein DFQ28_000438 [Apophysomyces sp. BC1034]|nr:hypothetical protein DFQ30_000443 [Apophysomyces sp. BC1015]KAG0178083.1 hypothetical protein DFQ29_003961 [Apophysomyces sp. BC1021]KAG0191321.1 hypothetical protein DFQ28_000438 [Apophysomyces sp. BC1034]